MNHVGIHSPPRSGSTWLGCILDSSPHVKYSYQPLFSYKYKSYLDVNATKEEINEFFQLIYSDKTDRFINQIDAKEKEIIPSFQKTLCTHSVYKEVRYHHLIENVLTQNQKLLMVLLIRNPIDTLNSWINAPKEFETAWSIEEEWLEANRKNLDSPENFYGFTGWKVYFQIMRQVKKKFPNQVFTISYSDLDQYPIETIQSTFSFLNLPFEESTYQFIRSSKSFTNTDHYSVYKAKRKDYSYKLPDHIVQKIQNTDDYKLFTSYTFNSNPKTNI